jgi:hypothetical protein
MGILPFVSAAVDRSFYFDDLRTDRHFIYFLKLFGDSANAVSITAATLFFGGVLALLGATSIAIFRRLRHRGLMPFDWLLAVVIVGACVTVVASFVFTTFNPLVASYSIWLFAPVGVLIAIGAQSRIGFRSWDNVGRFIAITMMVLGSAQATTTFFSNSTMFVHGPNRFIGGLYDSAEDPKAIVYEAGAFWKFPYFPLVFSHRNKIDQYRAADNEDGLFRIVRGQDDLLGQPIKTVVAPYKTVLVVDTRLRTYRDIRECQNGNVECRRLTSGPVELALVEGGQWREIKAERMFGLYDTQVKIFEYIGNR